MNEKIFNYNGHEIHTYENDGEIWFKAVAIGMALGYVRGSKACKEHLGVSHMSELQITDKRGCPQKAYVLTEPNVWRLLEKLPTPNEDFSRWFEEECSPYVKETKIKIISSDDLLKKLRAKASCFYQVFLKTHNIYMTTEELARDYGRTERWLTATLIELGFFKRKKGKIAVSKVYPQGKYWVEWEDDGFTTIMWTSKGVLRIVEELEKLGHKTVYDI